MVGFSNQLIFNSSFSIPNAVLMTTGFFRLGGLVPDYECTDVDKKFYLSSNQVRKNQAAACDMVRSCKNLTAHNAWVSIFQEFEVGFEENF